MSTTLRLNCAWPAVEPDISTVKPVLVLVYRNGIPVPAGFVEGNLRSRIKYDASLARQAAREARLAAALEAERNSRAIFNGPLDKVVYKSRKAELREWCGYHRTWKRHRNTKYRWPKFPCRTISAIVAEELQQVITAEFDVMDTFDSSWNDSEVGLEVWPSDDDMMDDLIYNNDNRSDYDDGYGLFEQDNRTLEQCSWEELYGYVDYPSYREYRILGKRNYVDFEMGIFHDFGRYDPQMDPGPDFDFDDFAGSPELNDPDQDLFDALDETSEDAEEAPSPAFSGCVRRNRVADDGFYYDRARQPNSSWKYHKEEGRYHKWRHPKHSYRVLSAFVAENLWYY